MTREGFDGEFRQLEEALQEQGREAAAMVSAASALLRRFSAEAFEEVVRRERRVADGQAAIEHRIETLLAMHGPVASDLRIVLASLHVNRSLERIAHNAARVAHLTTPAPRQALVEEAVVAESLRIMGERGEEMARTAMDCFARRDAAAARILAALDEAVDRENENVLGTVLGTGTMEGELRNWGVRMLFAARWLERIGDHAVNIGERVTYMATGEPAQVFSS